MIIIVCGGRDYTAREEAFRLLDQLHAAYPVTGVVQGEARGADTLGKQWAYSRGITTYSYPADWDAHGRKAGAIRNADMLKNNPPPTYCVAFPGGVGTADMIRKANKEGLVVWQPLR